MLNSTLYVTLEPCTMCLGAIQSFRVRRVVYGAKNRLLGAVESYVRLLEPEHPFHRVEVTGGVREEECARLMTTFFAARRQGRLQPQHPGRSRDDDDDGEEDYG
jgi:tRNA(adenine34) deaminase